MGTGSNDRSAVPEVTDVVHDYRRAQVVEAATAVFQRTGSFDMPLAEIAKQAGLSRSTVYNHFSTKEDVLVACLAAAQQKLVADTKAAVALASDDPVRQLIALFTATTQVIYGNPALFRLSQELLAKRADDGYRAAAEMAMLAIELSGIVRSVLQRGAASGAFAFDDLAAAESLVLATLIGELYRRSFNSRDPDPRASEQLVHQLIAGLAAGPMRRADRKKP
jgi:AcrR family transcriptional regulator